MKMADTVTITSALALLGAFITAVRGAVGVYNDISITKEKRKALESATAAATEAANRGDVDTANAIINNAMNIVNTPNTSAITVSTTPTINVSAERNPVLDKDFSNISWEELKSMSKQDLASKFGNDFAKYMYERIQKGVNDGTIMDDIHWAMKITNRAARNTVLGMRGMMASFKGDEDNVKEIGKQKAFNVLKDQFEDYGMDFINAQPKGSAVLKAKTFLNAMDAINSIENTRKELVKKGIKDPTAMELLQNTDIHTLLTAGKSAAHLYAAQFDADAPGSEFISHAIDTFTRLFNVQDKRILAGITGAELLATIKPIQDMAKKGLSLAGTVVSETGKAIGRGLGWAGKKIYKKITGKKKKPIEMKLFNNPNTIPVNGYPQITEEALQAKFRTFLEQNGVHVQSKPQELQPYRPIQYEHRWKPIITQEEPDKPNEKAK